MLQYLLPVSKGIVARRQTLVVLNQDTFDEILEEPTEHVPMVIKVGDVAQKPLQTINYGVEMLKETLGLTGCLAKRQYLCLGFFASLLYVVEDRQDDAAVEHPVRPGYFHQASP